jgi:hypothetical protein
LPAGHRDRDGRAFRQFSRNGWGFNPDDFAPFRIVPVDGGPALPDRILLREQAGDHRMVDDETPWGIAGAPFVERPPGKHARADRDEILRTDSVDEGGGLPSESPDVQFLEPAHEEGGAREQDHGEGELADDENATEALMPAASRGTVRPALQGAVDIEPHGEKRRRDAEGEDRGERGAESPSEHAPVEVEHDGFAGR